MSDSDLEAQWKARMEHKLQEWKPDNEIKQPPKAFYDWMIDNAKLLPLLLNQINMASKKLFNPYKNFVSGGKVEIMEGYTKKSDHNDLLAISRHFAEKGDKVQITTNIHFKDEKYKEVFGGLDGTPYKRKCPDLIINGKYYEYESYLSPFKKEKISRMISHGAKQSSRIIINNTKGASDRYIINNILSRLKDKTFNYDIAEVWVYEKGATRLLYKKTVGD